MYVRLCHPELSSGGWQPAFVNAGESPLVFECSGSPRVCKTLIMGSNPIVASSQQQATTSDECVRCLLAAPPPPIPDRLSPKLRQGIVFDDCVVFSVVGDRVSERLSEPFGDRIPSQQADTERARNELLWLGDAVGPEHAPRPQDRHRCPHGSPEEAAVMTTHTFGGLARADRGPYGCRPQGPP